MDPTAQVALLGVVTTMVASGAGIAVAFINSRRPQVEATLRERLALKDERITRLESELAEKTAEVEQLKTAPAVKE